MNALENLFAEATARDVLVTCFDIFLVYYVIYRVLLTIKGTRAAQMVIGLFLIGAGFFAADRFEMTTVSWLLDNFINYFIIIIIVVFQQDIRRGLVKLGQNVFPFGRTREVTYALDEVVAAAEQLAKARIGAIVVIEREAELDDFLEQGERIDAVLSTELLAALFVPSRDNQLHDGAVVVDKQLRIGQAGAVLPLSRQPMAKLYGTRHRAALGITEETDAVALVVSEERGEMSLCFGGNIARDLESDALRAALVGLFYGEKSEAVRVAEEAQAAAEISKAVASIGEAAVRDKAGDKAESKADKDKTDRIATGGEPAARAATVSPEPAEEPG